MFNKNTEQSIVFIFEFATLLSVKSSFKKLQHSFGLQETSIRENNDGTFQLRVTRVFLFNRLNINKHKKELIEDLTYYGGKFIEFKVHKVAQDGNIVNKHISTYTKVLTFLTKIGGTKVYKKYNMPFFSVIFAIIVIVTFSALKI